MDILIDIARYYYYFICVSWIVSTYLIFKIFLNSKSLHRNSLLIDSFLNSLFIWTLAFYLCVPISFFYFNRIESNKTQLSFKSIWNLPIYERNEKNARYRVDVYDMGRSGGIRRRIAVQLGSQCLYSHILVFDPVIENYIPNNGFVNDQNLNCKRADDVELDITLLRVFFIVIFVIPLAVFQESTKTRKSGSNQG